MILQVPSQGETAESVQLKVDALFSEAPLSSGLRKLADQHGSLADPSAGRLGRRTDLGWLPDLGFLSPISLILLALLLLAGIIVYARIRRGYWLGRDPDKQGDLPTALERVAGSTAMRQKAQQQALSGDYREAIRLLLLSLLTLISERRLLTMATNLTTREIYARLPKNQESEEEYLAHFFHVFEEASYGGRHMGSAEFEDLDGILGRGIQHELLTKGSES